MSEAQGVLDIHKKTLSSKWFQSLEKIFTIICLLVSNLQVIDNYVCHSERTGFYSVYEN